MSGALGPTRDALDCLPVEMWERVFFYLDTGVLSRARSVCSLFNTIILGHGTWGQFVDRECFFLSRHLSEKNGAEIETKMHVLHQVLERKAGVTRSFCAGPKSDLFFSDFSPYEKAWICCDIYVCCFFNVLFSGKMKGRQLLFSQDSLEVEAALEMGLESKNLFEVKRAVERFVATHLKGKEWLNGSLSCEVLRPSYVSKRTGSENPTKAIQSQYNILALTDGGAKLSNRAFTRVISDSSLHPHIRRIVEAGVLPSRKNLALALHHRCPYDIIELFLKHVIPTVGMVCYTQNFSFYSPRVAFLMRGIHVIENELDLGIQTGKKPDFLRKKIEEGHAPSLYSLWLALHFRRSYGVVKEVLKGGVSPSSDILRLSQAEDFYSHRIAFLIAEVVARTVSLELVERQAE
ncbi:MAG: F-box protein [Verrucomicrobia bacterium]|nr:F-box protein [Verrucomicrobiota bacterium]MBS0646705.1 F-box protein [Verrucomicrobiota bacterium]